MATVSGTLQDFGYAPVGNNPVLKFIPSSPSGRGEFLLSDEPVYATVASNGTFTVNLEPTQNLPGNITYRIEALWLDTGGVAVGRSWWGEIPVPIGGGQVGDLIGNSLPNDLIYMGTDVPTDSQITKYQVNTTTWDLYERTV